MAEEKLDKLQEKKKALEQELENIQGELDHSFDKVRDDVSDSLAPSEVIKRHPLPAVGISVLVGFLASHQSKSGSTGYGAGSLLYSEIKRLLTKKGIAMATDYIEEILLEESSGDSDDSNAVKKD